MQELNDRVAVVTGGGSGIGRGIALGLADEKMTVAIADIRMQAAEAVAAEITERGGKALAVEVDVTSVESLETARDRIATEAGGVHLLCANAGVLGRIASLEEHTLQDWEYTLSVNLLGTVKTVSTFMPLLRKSAPDAHIVNTASIGGLISAEGFPIGAYIASKYACVGYSEVLRQELADDGIGVSVLCPGLVASELFRTSMGNRPDDFGKQAVPDLTKLAASGGETPELAKAMAAEDVGPIVVDAVRNNVLHILTHPQAREHVEERFAGVRADFDHADKLAAKS